MTLQEKIDDFSERRTALIKKYGFDTYSKTVEETRKDKEIKINLGDIFNWMPLLEERLNK